MSASKKKKKVKNKKKNYNKNLNNNKNVNNVSNSKTNQDDKKNNTNTITQDVKKDETVIENSSEKAEEIKEEIVVEKKIEEKIENNSNTSNESVKIHENNLTEKEVNKTTSEKPEYAKQMLKNKRKKNLIIICSVMIFLIFLLISTVFALLNINNSNIISGIKIDDVDVSKLGIEDAKKLLNEVTDKKLMPELNLKYNDNYSIKLKPEEIEYKYDVDGAILEAYNVGRDGNLFKNNYSILGTTLFNKKINFEYSYNENLLNDFIHNLNSELPGVVVEPSYYIEDKNLIISRGKDGIEVDRESLKKSIIDSINKRNIEEIMQDNYSQTLDIPVKDVKAKDIDIDKIHEEIYREPKDAYFETDPYQIFVDVDGVDFGVSIEEAKEIISKESKEDYSIPLKITKAEKTIQDLGKEAFPYTISKFSTKYDASNINRSTNLEIAARKINGKVLMPGEVFSFNTVVGKRTIEEGYKDAKIYADGGVVDGLAGGICQISSTLYNAVLFANLEIVERKNHSYPASYIQVGRDATVVYGTKDFQFRNSRSYPIKLEASVKNGVAEFIIYGVQEAEEYEIKILPVTTGTIPYGTTYVQDPSLAPGQQVVSQSGHLGYRVTTYIEKRLNGEVVSKDILSNDTYSPMQTIIRVGPAPAPVPVPTVQ